MLVMSQIHQWEDAATVVFWPQGSKRRFTRVEMDRWLKGRGVTRRVPKSRQMLKRPDYNPMLSVTCLLAIITCRFKDATPKAAIIHNQRVVRENSYARALCFV